MQGYSDRVNHALAFAAKHHDQQVRGGTRSPYFTQPANVGIILTRYGCDDQTIVAGVLHDVVEDYLVAGLAPETLERRIADKFGREVLDTARSVVQRRFDDDGIELSLDERRDDQLSRLAEAPEAALWVAAAHALHNAATLHSDLLRTVDPGTVWSRFHAGRRATLQWYRRLVDTLRARPGVAAIVPELSAVVDALELESQREMLGEVSAAP